MTRRGRSKAATISKMEHFVIIVNGWKSLTIVTKSSILDVAAVLDPPLQLDKIKYKNNNVLEQKETALSKTPVFGGSTLSNSLKTKGCQPSTVSVKRSVLDI